MKTTLHHVLTPTAIARLLTGWGAVLVLQLLGDFLPPPVPAGRLVTALVLIVGVILVAAGGVVVSGVGLCARATAGASDRAAGSTLAGVSGSAAATVPTACRVQPPASEREWISTRATPSSPVLTWVVSFVCGSSGSIASTSTEVP